MFYVYGSVRLVWLVSPTATFIRLTHPPCRCSAFRPNCPPWAAGLQKTPSGGWTPSLVVKLTCINPPLSNFRLLSVTGTVMEADWHPFGVLTCQLTALWGDQNDLMFGMSADSIGVLRTLLVCLSCSHFLKFIMNFITAPHAVCPTSAARL